MATTPPSPEPFSPVTTIAAATTNATAASPSRKPQPVPWTHQETVNLIQTYQEKWYSLKRGQLRANQWEEVAVTVAARCGYDYNEPSKSAVQCRHKMEKLRQRYRADKHRLSASGSGGARGWLYFDLMDQLERGPLPISARPLVSLMSLDYDNDEEDDEDAEYERESHSKSRSINYIVSQRPRAKFGGVSEFSREQLAKRLWRVAEEDDDNDDFDYDNEVEEMEEETMVDNERGLVSGLAAEIKAFAERFIGMENLKMEMMKETERCRLEMENKRIMMILESQQRIVDSIGKVFGSSKRMKITHDF